MQRHIRSLRGSVAEELTCNLREVLPEECGLAAAINLPDASRYVYDCLMLQEHRGEHGVGIVSQEGEEFHMLRRVGSVKQQLHGVQFDKQLPGDIAVGHNRYATKGNATSLTNTQPLFFNHTRYGSLSISHNGTLAKSNEIRTRLAQEGALFHSATDSELIGHLISRSSSDSLEEAVIQMTKVIPTAYSLLIQAQDKVIALRDPYGVRPLSIGTIEGGYLVCSENYTFDQYPDCRHVGDIQPGEMVVFERGKDDFTRIQYAEPEEHFCIFEGIYFSDPRSRHNGYWHEDFRYQLGVQMYRQHPDIQGDVVIPVLDSGKHAALGLAEASGIPYREYFKRLHNPPRAQRRSFTSATYDERVRTAYQKLHLRKEKVRGKRVVIVDDSIVRSTTMKIINQRLREAGVTSITTCISAPPIVDSCPYGMDFQDKSQLIAYNKSIEDICEGINSDRLIYVDPKGLDVLSKETYGCGTCSGCFGGRYPFPNEDTSS